MLADLGVFFFGCGFSGHREVKVSRDGTEIEPSIGAILVSRIDEASIIT